MEMRKCTKCGKEFEATLENFGYQNKAKGILKYECKNCFKETVKKSLAKAKNRGTALKVYVNSEEEEIIRKSAEKLNMDISTYLRYVGIKNQPIIVKDIMNIEKAETVISNFDYSISKVSNNINQIARALNSGRNISEETIIKLIDVQKKIDAKMEEIRSIVEKSYSVLYG